MSCSACSRGELAEIVALQDVEHLDQRHAAGGRRRHGDDVVAAIAAAQRRALDRAIILQIVRRHDAAGAAHRGGDLLGDAALVEGARAVVGDGLQRVGEIELQQPVAFVQRLAAVEEEACRGRPARQPFCARAAASRRCRPRPGSPAAPGAVAGAIRSASDELAGAVFFVRQREAGHGARHADGEP